MSEQFYVISPTAVRRTELGSVQEATDHALKLMGNRAHGDSSALYVVKVIRVVEPTVNAMITDQGTGNRHWVSVAVDDKPDTDVERVKRKAGETFGNWRTRIIRDYGQLVWDLRHTSDPVGAAKAGRGLGIE